MLLKQAIIDPFRKNPITPWVICFIFINIIFREYGATNEMSRYATLRAMAQEGTFKINNYKNWTIDWSIKDGDIFSNKAPGPMLLGFPLFFPLDQFSRFDKKQKYNKQGLRISPISSTPRVIMALALQIIPFVLLSLIIARWQAREADLFDSLAIHIFALAALYGNTASFFMNFLFGHGMTAIFVLALSYYLYRQKIFQCGLFFGLALLSEYTAAALLVPLVLAILYLKGHPKSWSLDFIKGGLFPGLLWCWYHYSTVGSIFSVPAQFQNPMWIDTAEDSNKLWGMFSLPNFKVVLELLIGNRRGLLITQPWVYAPFFYSFYILYRENFSKQDRAISFFLSFSLIILILINSSFNGWHGGATSGPRYLSMLFPAYAFMLSIHFRYYKSWLKKITYIGLAISLLLRMLVYGSLALGSESEPLWGFLYNYLIELKGFKGEARFFVIFASLIISGYFVYKREKKD